MLRGPAAALHRSLQSFDGSVEPIPFLNQKLDNMFCSHPMPMVSRQARHGRGALYNFLRSPEMTRPASILLVLPIWAAALCSAPIPEFDRARELYQRTEYQASLKLLLPVTISDAGAIQLIGQDYFMLGEYKKSTEAFDRALALGNAGQQLYLWAGRAYGRRAETSGAFTAAGFAAHAHKYFETAVQMNILDKEATGDLFDYYLGAPGFMGGGVDRARGLAQKVAAADPAEGQHMLAVLAERDKNYGDAEQHLRRAIELAPQQAARVMELARFFAKRGRIKESDELFDQALRIAPQDRRITFYLAETYIEGKRNLTDARALLETYLRSPLTPEDPPRQKAQELLSRTGSR
jgi:tetratricopeptide (TPR) repeat protein